MPTLKLNADGDIDLSSGGAEIISAEDETQQHITTRLKSVRGDWFLDPSIGLPLFDRILVRNVNDADVQNIYSTYIAATPGVDSVSTLTLTELKQQRVLQIDTDIVGQEGQFEFSTLVPLSSEFAPEVT